MAIKRNKSFSPYGYGIRYKKSGENPFLKYEYIPGGGQGEPVYVVTKKEPNFFCSIKNFWYFGIDDKDNISFFKVDSTILIDTERKKEYLSVSNISSSFESFQFNITKNNSLKHKWEDENTLILFHNIENEVDSIILLNDEYIDDKCTKYYYDGYIKIKFNNIDIKLSDSLIIRVYSISSSISFINSEFLNQTFNQLTIIDDQLNNRYLIENLNGAIDKKFIIKLKDDSILNNKFINILPTYISINKDDLLSLNDIDEIISYSSIKSYKTIIIQRFIDSALVTWNVNEKSAIITHGLNGDVNYIIDEFDNNKILCMVKKLDENRIKIIFNNLVYEPTVFAITIFKIGE